MPRLPRLRLALLLAALGLAAGCVGDGQAGRKGAECGVRAALAGEPEHFRESPPACALPKAAEVASACSVHDHVTSPGYRPSRYDEQGIEIDSQPLPTYSVSRLQCRFSSPDRNEARCRFQLAREGAGPIAAEASLRHRFVQDHGPAHHLYSVGWFANERCLPLAEAGAQQ